MYDKPHDRSWHHDAVIYQLHVKAFRDSHRDGFGDFRGLIEKLGYIAGVGESAIWLLPFYPSPLKHDGYDIADYTAVHANYGTIDDFREFLDAEYTDRVFLAEANQWPADVRPYFGDGDECHMAFHFPVMPRMYMAVAREDRAPIVDIMARTPARCGCGSTSASVAGLRR
jgi:hypothetical protein